MTYKYAMTIPGTRVENIPQALSWVEDFLRNEVNLNRFQVRSITLVDSDGDEVDIEADFTSPTYVSVDDFPMMVPVPRKGKTDEQ